MAKKSEGDDVEGKHESVAHMVREAIETLGWKVKPDAYRDYILQTFGKDVPKNQISQYKSAEKRKRGMNKKRVKAGQTSTPNLDSNPNDLDEILEFARDLRYWEDRIGAAKIKEVVAGLYKNS